MTTISHTLALLNFHSMAEFSLRRPRLHVWTFVFRGRGARKKKAGTIKIINSARITTRPEDNTPGVPCALLFTIGGGGIGKMMMMMMWLRRRRAAHAMMRVSRIML
jgi:hypothetical protein